MMLLEEGSRVVATSASAIGFETEGDGTDWWPVWDRYLTVDGQRAYYLGNICGTCSYMFERLEGANGVIDVGALDRELAAGGEQLSEKLVDALAKLVPVGAYSIALLRVTPVHALPGSARDYFATEQVENEGGVDPFHGLPHHPKVPYYRVVGCSAVPVADSERGKGRLFEFLVPMFPETLLDPERIRFYEAELGRGVEPTAVALSVLDVKGPAETGVDHWCLGHFLLDGHHKVAARSGRSLTLLAFVALEHGVSSPEQVAIALATNRRPGIEQWGRS